MTSGLMKPQGQAASGLRPTVDVIDRLHLSDGVIKFVVTPLLAVGVFLLCAFVVALEVYETIQHVWRHRNRRHEP